MHSQGMLASLHVQYLGFHGKLDDLEYVPVLEVVEPAWCSEFMIASLRSQLWPLTVAVDWLHISWTLWRIHRAGQNVAEHKAMKIAHQEFRTYGPCTCHDNAVLTSW